MRRNVFGTINNVVPSVLNFLVVLYDERVDTHTQINRTANYVQSYSIPRTSEKICDKTPDVRANILQNISERLKSFETLGADWAGPGSEAPDADITKNVLDVLNRVPTEFLKRIDIEDGLTPTPRGAVEIDWYADEKAHLSLEIDAVRANFYVKNKEGLFTFYENIGLADEKLLDLLKMELKNLLLT